MGEEKKGIHVFGINKHQKHINFLLEAIDFKLLVLGVLILCVSGIFFRSSGYAAFGVAVAIFLAVLSLSVYMIDVRCSIKWISSHLPLAISLSLVFIIVLFVLESIFPAAHFYSSGGHLFAPYPEHFYFPYLNLYLTIFLMFCAFPFLFIKIIIDAHAEKESIIKIDKANRLIESCMKSKGFFLMVAFIFWSIFFVMFLSYLLMKASNEEGAGLYIVYSVILIPIFFFPIVLIGTILAAAKTKKTSSALLLAIIKITEYVLLWTIISTVFIFVVGSLVYPFFGSSIQIIQT